MSTILSTQKEFDDNDKKSMVVFKREKCQNCFEEAIPLLAEHWQEIAYIDDVKLEPEFSTYELLEKSDRLRTYTARLEEKLIGYAVFFIQPHLHFKSTVFALCDIIFIKPEHRGFGHRFIRWCNNALVLDGARVIYYYVNRKYDYGVVLRRQGFRHTDDGYVWQLNNE